MKTNMTEKDKKLLVGMLIGVIIVAIGYWGIIPQLKAYGELETKIEKEEETQKLNKMKITNTSLIEMQAEDYEEKLAKVKDSFYQILNSAEIDQMFTDLATKRNLKIYELKFSPSTTPTERGAYVNSALYKRQEELKTQYEKEKKKKEEKEKNSKKTSTETSTESSTESSGTASASDSGTSSKATSELMEAINGAEEGGYQPNTEIFAVPVTITVGGEIGALEHFLADVESLDKTILLTSYSWGEYRNYVVRDANGNIISSSVPSGTSTTTSDSSVSVEGDGVTPEQLQQDTTIRKSLTVRVEIYMCDTSAVTVDGEATEETSEEQETETPESLLMGE